MTAMRGAPGENIVTEFELCSQRTGPADLAVYTPGRRPVGILVNQRCKSDLLSGQQGSLPPSHPHGVGDRERHRRNSYPLRVDTVMGAVTAPDGTRKTRLFSVASTTFAATLPTAAAVPFV